MITMHYLAIFTSRSLSIGLSFTKLSFKENRKTEKLSYTFLVKNTLLIFGKLVYLSVSILQRSNVRVDRRKLYERLRGRSGAPYIFFPAVTSIYLVNTMYRGMTRVHLLFAESVINNPVAQINGVIYIDVIYDVATTASFISRAQPPTSDGEICLVIYATSTKQDKRSVIYDPGAIY